ncbi:hypothetical protein [Anatilimnocola floriformis]|uniref:hypothetical protein n=1 Tax=Anatilimnocola floriformis TaxID=2948575 RepID=UPI0020C3ECDF|nr:hypothetical protein [Anatilimnocola floriformis]
MSRLVRRFSWKLFLLVVALAALSLSAPEAWRRYQARQASSQDALAALELAHSQSLTNESLPAFELPELPAETPEFAPVAIEPVRNDFAAFETPKQVAKTGPVVAEQIDNDPSLPESPTRTAVKVEPAIEFEKPAEQPPAEVPAFTPPVEVPATPAEVPVPSPSPSPSPSEPRTLPDAANHSTLKPSVPPDVAPAPENASAGAWPHATALVAQLRELATEEPNVAHWAQQTITQLEDLAKVNSLASPQVGNILDQLHALSLQARELAVPLKSDNQRSRVLRSGYAIVRRIAVWQLAHAVAFESEHRQTATPSTTEWTVCLTQLEQKLQSIPGGSPWITYLRLPQARKLSNSETSATDRRDLARDILRRLNSTQFDPQQGDFAESPVFFELIASLKNWADEPVNLTSVLQAIEDYERQDLTAESTALAEFYQHIRWSPDKKLAELGDTINSYYRNGNVRVAISAELVNRFLPKEARMAEYVQDYIQGAYVEGNSEASTRLRLVLLPDRLRWRLGLEAQGEVASDTSSTKGPATFYQNGTSHYRVRKMLLVDRRGVKLFNAEAEANANNHLNDYETSYDSIPILGSIARAIARDQYDAAQDSARAEVEGKIRGRATTRIDQAVAEQLKKGQENFKVKLLEPMRKLNLEPAPVDMETTNDRLIARYRLAGHEQLASHTPRPQAPGDSLLSVQVHESAFNNLLNHLNLSGKRYELRELHKEVTSIFTANPPPPPDDLPEDVYVTFMESDPIRVDCEDGRVRLTIRIKQLEHGKSKWQNFTVRGYYAPYSDQLEANLARDGVIELIGERLRVGDQIALRGIFSRVLSRNRTLNLVNKQIALAPELRDQQVTQLVIHDGWMGVALGPKHPERKTIGVTRVKQKDGETR